jgi:hypothetical protein
VWPDASERPEPAPACTHRCSCGHDQQDHSTSGYCNACEDHCDDNDGHYPDDCDARTTPDNPAGTYPHPDGDVTVLGPEIFASSDGAVISWKGENYVRPDNPTAEDLNSGPPNASRLDICELPHQTIAEEDDCHRRRDAGSDDGLRLALARIASDRAHHEHCASLARTSEGGIAHSSIAAGLQIAEAHLTAALDGPADTTPPAGSTAREAPGA